MRSARSGLLLGAALSLSACTGLPPPAPPGAAPVSSGSAEDDRLLEGITRYIESLADSRAKKNALKQLVAALNATLGVDLRVNASMKKVAIDVAEAVNCVWSVYGSEAAPERVEAIRRLVISTPARRAAYERYERARAGSVVAIPAQDTCK